MEKINHFKETIGVSAGLTAPVWLETFNAYVGAAIGLSTLIYAIGRVYFLFKNKGKE